jgi:hypothetical protein
MATDIPQGAGEFQTEHCSQCDQLTNHDVTVEIRTESDGDGPGSKFSREPYRVATCRACETESVQRMNNA